MSNITSTPPKKLFELLKNNEIILFDVRQPGEFMQIRIPGAVNIPLSSIHKDSMPPINGLNIAVHCSSGCRSKKAAKKLKNIFPEVTILNLDGVL